MTTRSIAAAALLALVTACTSVPTMPSTMAGEPAFSEGTSDDSSFGLGSGGRSDATAESNGASEETGGETARSTFGLGSGG